MLVRPAFLTFQMVVYYIECSRSTQSRTNIRREAPFSDGLPLL